MGPTRQPWSLPRFVLCNRRAAVAVGGRCGAISPIMIVWLVRTSPNPALAWQRGGTFGVTSRECDALFFRQTAYITWPSTRSEKADGWHPRQRATRSGQTNGDIASDHWWRRGSFRCGVMLRPPDITKLGRHRQRLADRGRLDFGPASRGAVGCRVGLPDRRGRGSGMAPALGRGSNVLHPA